MLISEVVLPWHIFRGCASEQVIFRITEFYWKSGGKKFTAY